MRVGRPLTTVAIVAVIAAAAAALVTASWEFSRERIAANRRAQVLATLSSVLGSDDTTRELAPIQITAEDAELLGTTDPVDVFVIMNGNRAEAVVFASVAPNGYNAPIELLVGIDAATNRITGVRAVRHRETPGLGDLIDIRKSSWILQFDDKSLEDPPAEAWAVKRDGGQFDAITGATVTPRAVVSGVRDTLLYFRQNREALIGRALRQLREAADAQ